MRMFVAPPDTRPRPVHPDVRETLRLRTAREVFQDKFGLTHHQAAFLAALYHGRHEGMIKARISEAAGICRDTVPSTYVRTRHLGVETDGQEYRLTSPLRETCREALFRDSHR